MESAAAHGSVRQMPGRNLLPHLSANGLTEPCSQKRDLSPAKCVSLRSRDHGGRRTGDLEECHAPVGLAPENALHQFPHSSAHSRAARRPRNVRHAREFAEHALPRSPGKKDSPPPSALRRIERSPVTLSPPRIADPVCRSGAVPSSSAPSAIARESRWRRRGDCRRRRRGGSCRRRNGRWREHPR